MAFHQQPLHPDSRPLTQCYTPDGIYQWRINVMGLQDASQKFQQMMDDRLQPVKEVASPYIDDILLGTWVEPGKNLLAAHTGMSERFGVVEKGGVHCWKVETFCQRCGVLWPHFGKVGS